LPHPLYKDCNRIVCDSGIMICSLLYNGNKISNAYDIFVYVIDNNMKLYH